MGDCRIKIIVSKQILASHADGITIKVYPSDTTIREIRDDCLTSLSKDTISVWDCTLHPSKDVTSWLFDEFPEKSGPKSKTLYDAGCFPSAVWQVLPKGASPSTQSVLEDRQYCQQSGSAMDTSNTVGAGRVQLLDQQVGLKPSEVLHNVTQRFEGDEEDAETAHVFRQKKLKERKAKETARHAKLEERIKKLGAIKSGTSEQVRKMLLKSRCTGVKSLKMQDRVYLQIALVKEETVSEDFRYFSRQDTVARLIQNISDAKAPQEAELLISTSGQAYRRLPLTTRMYEAIEKGWLKEADTIVVRYFTPPEQEPTTSILEEESTEAEDSPMIEAVDQERHEDPTVVQQEISPSSTSNVLPQEVVVRFTSAIAQIDKKLKPKKSSSAQRVRQMMMKSKSKGDAKRVPKMENRFFVELLLVEKQSAASSFVFTSKRDTLDRLLKEHVKVCGAAYAIQNGTDFVELSREETLEDLEAQQLLLCFDRLIVDKSKL